MLVCLGRLSGLGVVGLGLAACAGNPPDEAAQRNSARVLVIGVDGLRPDQMLAADAPRLQALQAEGIHFPDATNTWRPDAPSNGHSTPNWAALLTGRLPGATGLRVNGDLERPDDPDRRVDDRSLSGDVVRTIFWHAKKGGAAASTAVFNTWWGIGLAEGTILGRSAPYVDHHVLPGGEGDSSVRDVATAAASARSLAKKGPELTFVHLGQVDSAGHAYTYESPETRAAIERVDALVGTLLDAIASRPTRADERWLVVVTSDHGGPDDGTNHADNGDVNTRRIPLILWGDDLPSRSLRTTGRLVDVAPTVLEWLGADVEGVPFDGVSLFERP